jgi:hypothetical protein
MKHDPTLAMVIITGIFSTWKSYPTLGDLAVWAGLLGCFPEIISSESSASARAHELQTCVILSLP